LCSLFAICRFVFSPLEVVAFSSLGLWSWTVAEQELGSILLPAVGASISSRAVVAFLSGLGEWVQGHMFAVWARIEKKKAVEGVHCSAAAGSQSCARKAQRERERERERDGCVGCELKLCVRRSFVRVEEGALQTDEAGGCVRPSNWKQHFRERGLCGAGGYARWFDGPSASSATTGNAAAWQELQLPESVTSTSYGSWGAAWNQSVGREPPPAAATTTTTAEE
jgi:hypothetical protein